MSEIELLQSVGVQWPEETSMIRHSLRGLALMLLLAGPVVAWPMAGNQRIDRALYHGHDPRTIVAGHVEAHLVDALADEQWESAPPLSEVVFQVEHVLLGEDVEAGECLRFSTRNFVWPTELVPMARDAKCFLIYDSRREGGHEGYPLTVIPWSGKSPHPVKDRDDAQRLMAAELVAALATEASEPRKRELVLQMLPVVSPEQAEAAFTPLLASSDPWLRRAAVAGLAHASPQAVHVERAAADLEAFIRATPEDAMIETPGGAHAAYARLFRHYAYLQTNWSEEERQRLRHCLPLFRVVAEELGKSPHYQWEYGLSPLTLLGDQDDLSVLLTYYEGRETKPEGLISERPHVRFAVMQKLAALLKVEFVATHEQGEIRQEEEQQRIFREALSDRDGPEESR